MKKTPTPVISHASKDATTPADCEILLGRCMIVIGSMLGGGVFNLPSSISQSAGVVASLLAWLITGVGLLSQ
jgi:hypothetical protein